MKRTFLIFTFLIIIFSCGKEETIKYKYELDDCGTEYFYYGYGEVQKFYLGNLVPLITITFDDVDDEKAYEVLSKYEFLHVSIRQSFEDNIPTPIYQDCNCEEYKNILITLNNELEIESATPVFEGGIRFQNRISLVPVAGIDSSTIVSYCSDLGLELIEKVRMNAFIFKVRESDLITGFEIFDIANAIYESGKVEYSTPIFSGGLVLQDQ